jgi:acyl-CoA dehydrogenase
MDLYLVEAGTRGFEKGNKLSKMGWRSQDTAELFFNDCRIPQSLPFLSSCLKSGFELHYMV